MVNKLGEWLNDHKEEVEAEQERNEKHGQKCKKLDSETVINVNDITEITESVFEFSQGNGNVQKVKRYFYHFGDYVEEEEGTHPYLIPKSVHLAILEQIKEYGDKLTAVKIKKKGTGKETEYTVFGVQA